MGKVDPELRLPPTNHDYKIFNSHCHLNDDSEYIQADHYLKEAQEFNVTDFIVVGSNQTLNDRAIKICKENEHCLPAVGWHPDSWAEYSDEKLNNFIEQKNKIPLIGEIGLDYHYEATDHLEQQEVFIKQLEIAKEYQIPVSIHTRDAFDDTINILKEHNITSGIIHNFNTDKKQAEAYLNQGFMLSISGVVTFKNAEDLRKSLSIIPLDRILVETDDPYLTPVPFRGQSNHPAYVYFTLRYLAELFQVDLARLANQTYQNTERLIHGK
ncbi:TatD family hydrolase [Xylocopilactobacillus apicola]|uniref:TatD family hydrolase n=1 Tax=Xylocopilactobacillus apicola TaxID=2932184 RepID=A0AAU9D7S0_9LACO|nr:TatD family hydrolase [Xylocopilactobacillus apicola]BDR58436.1 TatD family hydrolase [Xylocopilactobacillus apicola]